MHNLPFEFTEADRTALMDELTRRIARVPRLVGTEVNWIEQAARAVLKSFEEQSMDGVDQLILRDVENKIRLFATSVDPFAAFKAATDVYAKLREFFRERSQTSSVENPSIPKDKTHDFGQDREEARRMTADRDPLADQLIRLIAQTPSLVGKEFNWIELASTGILNVFDSEGIERLSFSRVGHLIGIHLTPSSTGSLFSLIQSILDTLRDFEAQQDAEEPQEDAPVPTDETHDFGVIAKELIDNGSGIDMLEVGPSVVLTEAQALKALAGLKGLDSDVEFVLIARPKPPRWKVLDYQG